MNNESPIPSNSLSSIDVAFGNDESYLCSDTLSSRDDALENVESPSTFDPPWIDVEDISLNIIPMIM